MRIVFFALFGSLLAVVAGTTDDSVAMESESYHKLTRHREEGHEGEGYKPRPVKKYYRGNSEGRKNLVHREREARDEEEGWKGYRQSEIRGPVYELPPGYELEGKYYEEPDHSSYRYYHAEENNEPKQKAVVQYESYPKKGKDENESLKSEPSQHPGSYLNHIKENMKDGKLLGFSSFVEHFSENDDAEELKTAMREGSLEDIKKLVPKSSVSFQMYHGEEKKTTVKTLPPPPQEEVKQEVSWNDLNEWHQPSPTAFTPPQTHYVKHVPQKTFLYVDRKKRMRKHPERVRLEHRPLYHLEDSRKEQKTEAAPEPEVVHKVTANEVYQKEEEEQYPQIVPSISFELPSETFKGEKEYEVVSVEEARREQDRQESQPSYHSYGYDGDHDEWRPISEKTTTSEHYKVINTPKPPESSKIYYDHFKTSKPFEETSKFSQLPKVGRIVVDQPETSYVKHTTKYSQAAPETYHYVKKPVRMKVGLHKRPTPPTLASGEDFNQRYAQIQSASPASVATRLVTPQPTRQKWSKPDSARDGYGKLRSPKVVPTPVKLEKIINKQADGHGQIERPGHGKENGNIFLTKEFQNEISEYFKGGKSDFEWVPSTQIRYDSTSHGSNPVPHHAGPVKTEPAERPKRYRIYRSERNLTANQGNPKNVVILGPGAEREPGEFSVSASYKIEKNRKSDEPER